ncbi:hypothetical protein CEXT_184691 [Caerostris extrusa]|uniref:Uncharacterized protein n=1 Tax=Caerostris extrusa TaxID=172846 RepID=A0AAV4P3V6_CAEEX|nr:hypothetical protein CEXT_184691 [Caerostris extrusa]
MAEILVQKETPGYACLKIYCYRGSTYATIAPPTDTKIVPQAKIPLELGIRGGEKEIVRVGKLRAAHREPWSICDGKGPESASFNHVLILMRKL